MYKLIFLSICFSIVLIGCNGDYKNKTDEKIYPQNYSCNETQLELVKKEFNICKETGYFDSYCFSQAKVSQCDKIRINNE